MAEAFRVRETLLATTPTLQTIQQQRSMATGDASQLAHLPDEMFTIIKATANHLAPRLGRLSPPGRKAIDTPHYLAITSRGVVPHITQDTFMRDTRISGVYVGLEDCKPALLSLQADSADKHVLTER